jgi:hypothetical protein
MSFANPTPLRVGMVGVFSGKRYRVAGRIVMGMDDAGATYYWNEFNLVNLEGESATLVYEETESGGQWRMFVLFDPQFPMTAPDAAARRVGDQIDFGDGQVRVTVVDESRVYHIEGEAPEGVEVGDVARYFNAEAGNKMIVVSWTGDEVEYYTGVDLASATVTSAFNLPAETPKRLASFLSTTESGAPPMPNAVKFIGGFLILVVLFASYSSCRPLLRRQAGIAKTSAPVSPLKAGLAGTLDGRKYEIRAHAVVEIGQVGFRYDRHEYHLIDETGNPALLVYGWKPGVKDWLLFTPLKPLEPLSPLQAAAVRWGQTVNVDGIVVPVNDLCQSTVRQVEGQNAAAPGEKAGDVFYNFSGKTDSMWLLVRWHDGAIAFYRGQLIDSRAVTAAFKP